MRVFSKHSAELTSSWIGSALSTRLSQTCLAQACLAIRAQGLRLELLLPLHYRLQ